MSKDTFFDSTDWQKARYAALRRYGFKCMACGISREDGAVIQVDHIRPRSKYPHLALVDTNLQPLCRPCNMGKSNIFEDDFTAVSAEQAKVIKRKNRREFAYKRLRAWVTEVWRAHHTAGNAPEAKRWLHSLIRLYGEDRMREFAHYDFPTVTA